MAQAIIYIESSLPPEITISEYRRQRPKPQTRWQRVKALVGLSAVTPAVAR